MSDSSVSYGIGAPFLVALTVFACTQSDRVYKQPPSSTRPSAVVQSSERGQPSVLLESPKHDSLFAWGDEIRVSAAVKELRDASVEFRANDSVIATDATPPYEVYYRPASHGTLTFTAQVRDSNGSVVAGDAVTVEVQNPNPVSAMDELTDQDYAVAMLGPLPLVTLSAPVDGVLLQRGLSVRLAGETSGTAAAVVRVEFLLDGTALGSQSVSAPSGEPTAISRFEHWWKATPGAHTIAARATDANGLVGMSKSVMITVK